MNKWYNALICDSERLKFLPASSQISFLVAWCSTRMLILIFSSTAYPYKKVVHFWYRIRSLQWFTEFIVAIRLEKNLITDCWSEISSILFSFASLQQEASQLLPVFRSRNFIVIFIASKLKATAKYKGPTTILAVCTPIWFEIKLFLGGLRSFITT